MRKMELVKLPCHSAPYVTFKRNPVQWWFSSYSISSIFFSLCLVLRFQMILSARSTDELDNGYRFAGESSNWNYHWNYSYGKESQDISTALSSSTSSSSTFDVDISKVLKYWGCYKFWTGEEYNYSDRFKETKGLEMNAEKCVKSCQENFDQEFQVAMVKGVYCHCVNWEHFRKIRIQEKFCNFLCPHPSSTSISILGMEGRELCGGNIAVSVYCNFSLSEKCTEINWDETEGLINSTAELVTTTTKEMAVFDEAEEFGPQIIQACAYCNVTYMSNNSAIPLPNCGVYGGTKRTQDYFPANNPQDCIDNCKNIVYDNQTVQKYDVAILSWLSLSEAINGVDRIPICRCENENPMKKFGWYPLNRNSCSSCPGDSNSLCGSGTQAEFSHYFTIYCAISGAACEFDEHDEEEEGGNEGGGEDYHTNYNNSSFSPDSPTPNSTTASTTIETTEVTDWTTTTEIPKIPTTNGVVIVTMKTTTASTTTTTTTANTTSTTTNPPPLIDCSIKCEATDHYNQTWSACAREIKENNCPDDKSGTARWKCLVTGNFESSSPDFSNCTAGWYDDLYQKINDTIANNKTLLKDESEELLKTMEVQCTVTNTNKVPYFGHEIRLIAAASWRIVNLTVAKLDERKSLLAKAINMPGLLLKNKEPWREMNLTERAIAGREIIQSIELSMFTLSQNVDSTNPNFSHTQRADALNKAEFQATFGVRLRSNSNRSSLTFPIDAPPKSSFIELSEGWEDLVPKPEFVGISIDPKYIQNILSPRLSSGSLQQKENSTSKRLINGRLLSLSIKGLDSVTTTKLNNLKGKKVKITFKHEIEAWGSKIKDIPRKLHEGEIPKVAMGSAICVYWNTEKLEWNKDGCRLIESTKTHTVCECTHLTSFAVLMDTHNYVGKDFVLEILTFILSPLSVICLVVSIIVFSTVAAIQNQRTTITKHLSICLLIGNVAILFVVDRHYFNLPEGICIGVGIMTHYIFLSAFCWMQIEGIHLYKMVVFVFESGRSHTTIYRIIAYGIPVLFVGINCVVGFLLDDHPYGSDMYCWLEGPYIWSFAGPVALVIMANMIILFVALKTAYQMKAATASIQTRQRSYKTWIRGSFSITIILGITWIPGFFVTTGGATAATVAAYMFVILNASQGIFLFVFHCFMNEKVRIVAERNLSLPSWLSIPSNPSKEVTQSGKRSDVMRGMYSETSKSLRQYEPENNNRLYGTTNTNKISNGSISSVFNPDFNPYPGYSKDPNHSLKAHESVDSGLNESRTSSQKSLVHGKRK